MPVSPVPYDIFTTSNGGFVNEGGPWHYDRSSHDVNIGSQNGVNWCQDVPYCITAWMYPSASLTFYSVSFFANISVDMNQYANSNSLQCTFSYRPLWISTKSAEGTAIPMKLIVASSSFEDTITAGNFDRPTITHDADIPLIRTQASPSVYIPIYLNITWPRQDNDYINYYVKSLTFKINTPSSGGTTTTVSAAGASNSGIGPTPEPKKDQASLIVAVLCDLYGVRVVNETSPSVATPTLKKGPQEMPKSSKKQKEKSSDFKKAKLKLGKGKKPANNAVDTSFKAHSIALPTQSIMVEKSGPTTKKHQSLSDLVSLLKHYSSNSRKDALVGLRELFSTYADILTSSVPVVLPACCKLLSDEIYKDGSVRKANIQFMDWYLRHISQNTIAPHSSALMLYVTSALTHIFPEIRIDAIKILDILLDVCPGIVMSSGPNGHAHRVLQGYLGLLVGDVMRSDDEIINTSAVTLSAQSKLSVITSLARFLQKVSDDTSSDSELWYLRGSFNSAKAYQSFVELLSDTHKSSTLEPMSDTEIAFFVDDTWSKTENWSIEDVKHAFDFCLLDSPDISASESGGLLEKAEKYLHRLLVELWLDHGPPAMMALDSRTDPSTELRIVVSTLRLARSLYFDVREPVWEELQAINLIYSELLAICLLSRQGPVSSRSIPNDKAMSTGPLDMEKEISRISPWIL
ncbi:hypothetical protein FRC17_002243, partial [Serendipita sp. 399]